MVFALELNNLSKTYKNGVTALKNLNLTVEAGDFYALLGPNGAGKSTTIGIISSLVTKTSGKVTIFGYDLDTQPIEAKKQLGLVPQEFNFNPFEKVRQIVENQGGYYGLPRKKAKENAEKYLRLLGLWDKRESRARLLSGGMKRRLMIARALVHEPKMLILDEPTAGVDIELRRSMWETLKEMNQNGMTIILTTHYLEEAEMLCRHIGIVQAGELIINTTMKALLSTTPSQVVTFEYTPIDATIHLDGYTFKQVEQGVINVELTPQKGLNQLIAQFSAQNINILNFAHQSNRLESLFVDLVQSSKKTETKKENEKEEQ